VTRDRKEREMRETEAIIGLISERGKKGLSLERLYRLLFNRNLYLEAYGKIYQIWIAIPLTPFDTLLYTL
jgi:hypothetical protein